jgi:hypothetical protein
MLGQRREQLNQNQENKVGGHCQRQSKRREIQTKEDMVVTAE